MANIIGSQGNIQKIRTGYRKVLALGEGVASDEFRMTFEGYSDISYLVQSTQLPALAREPIESFGPNGVQFVQQGRYKNAQEVPISFKEVITGKIYEFLRAQLRGKKYYTVKLALVGNPSPPQTTILLLCLKIAGSSLKASISLLKTLPSFAPPVRSTRTGYPTAIRISTPPFQSGSHNDSSTAS